MMEYWNVEGPVFSGVGFKGKFLIYKHLELPCQYEFYQ